MTKGNYVKSAHKIKQSHKSTKATLWIKDGCKNLIQKKYWVLQEKWGWIGMIWEKTQVTNRKTTSFAWKLLSHFELYFYKRIQQIKKDLHAQENETVFLLMNRKKNIVHVQVSDRGDRCSLTALPISFILRFNKSKISFNCKKRGKTLCEQHKAR